MNSRDDYRPISCEQHSAYELAIMHGQKLRLSWRDEDGQAFDQVVLPVDLQTRNGREYLLVRRGEETLSIRLDDIHRSEETST